MFGIEREDGVFDRELLVRVDSLAMRLERLPLVMKVLSPTRISEPVITPVGVFETPYLRLDQMSDTSGGDLLALDSARIWNDPRVRDMFFSDDARAMIVVLNAEPGLSKVKCDDLLVNVRRVMSESGFASARVVGRIVGQDHYINTMVKEMLFFLTASILLLAVFLWIGFRSLYGVLVPIAVVGLSILWQVGFMTAIGKPLGILTMLLPTILFVVGMSDVVHILECYLEEIRRGAPRIRAIAVTYHEVGLPTFLTAVTSGIGFATLGTASIQPLQEFGYYTALGVLLAFCLAFVLLPALLVLIDPARLLPRKDEASPWDHRLPVLFQWTLRNRRAVLWGFAAITLVSFDRHITRAGEQLPAGGPAEQGSVEAGLRMVRRDLRRRSTLRDGDQCGGQ